MDMKLRIFLIVCTVLYLLVILYLLKKKKINLKYTMLWLVTAVIMLIITIFPGIITWITSAVGIVDPPNLIFFVEGIFVLVILLSLTGIVSGLTNRIYRLTQSQALLEERIRDIEKNIKQTKI